LRFLDQNVLARFAIFLPVITVILIGCGQGDGDAGGTSGRPAAEVTVEEQGPATDPREGPDSPLAWANLAASLAASGLLEEAEAAILKALEISPETPALLAELARLQLALGKEAEAQSTALQAADLDHGSDPRLYLLATSTRLRLGQGEEAAVDLTRWEEEHGSYPLLTVARGLVYESAAQLEDAEAAYQSALHADPRCREALSGLVKLSFERGDPEAALAAIRQASAAGAAPRIWEGQALRRLDRLEEAEAAYQEALRLEPDHAVALADLGALRAMQGNFAEARSLLARALDLQPNLAGARANLEKVDHHLSETQTLPTTIP